MSLESWIVTYSLQALVHVWVIFFRGAHWLEGTFTSGFLISAFAPNWSAEGIRLFSWLTLILTTLIFVVGIFEPSVRALL